jgi:hypothetical protein
MIEMWVDIVEDLTAEVALKALPHHLQELFVNVDPESTVCAHRYIYITTDYFNCTEHC